MTFMGLGGRPGPGRFGRGGSTPQTSRIAVSYGACSSLVISTSVRPAVRSWTCWISRSQASPSRLPGTTTSSNRLSESTAVWSQSSPRSRSNGSSGSHDASFWPTKAHFSSTWTSRVRGGKGPEFLVHRFGMSPGLSAGACDGVLIHSHQAAGGPRPAALADVIQHVEDRRVGQSCLLQDRPLAFREAGLTSAAGDHADPLAPATPAPEGEISMAPAAGIGAVGMLLFPPGPTHHNRLSWWSGSPWP